MAKKAPAKTSAKKAARKTAKKATKSAARPVKARKADSKAKTSAATKPRAKTSATKRKAPRQTKTARDGRRKPLLTKPQLREFRDLLLDKRRSLIGDMNGIEAEALRHTRGESGDLSSMPTHPADLGTDNYEQEFTLGLLESERGLLGEINEALERIANGTYGLCQGTGKPIGLARLRAKPWAKYSIEYARMVEKGLVRPGERVEDGNGHDDFDD